MTALTRAVLKTSFQTGDTPTGDDFANMIDSALNTQDTTAQVIQSDLRAANVSAAGNVVASAKVCAGTAVEAPTGTFDNITASANVCAATGYFDTLNIAGTGIINRAYGELYVTVTAPSTIASAGEFRVANGTTSATGNIANFTHTNPFRLTYTGTGTAQVFCSINYSITASGNSKVVATRFGKNGTTVTASEIQRKIGTGTDIGAAGQSAIIQMAPNDYVEFFVANTTDTVGVTIEKAVMNVVAI